MKKELHYTDSGLDNVYLKSGFSIDADGGVFVEDIHGLLRAIGQHIVKSGQMRGQDVRYIRHYMDLSQKALGELLGVEGQTVLRWESEATEMPKTAEILLKSLFTGFLDSDAKIKDVVHWIADLDEQNAPRKIYFSFEKKSWKMAA